MNKKIIAIAIASAMAAPVAMADISVSGQMGGALVSTDVKTSDPFSGTTRPIVEAGYSKLQFDMTSGGSGYARGGLSLKDGFSGGAPTLRETYFGVKGDWGTFQLGRMASALKNVEKDPYISTFLQMRGTAAIAGDATEIGGFVNGLVQYAGDLGPVKLTVQLNPMEGIGDLPSNTGQSTSGHLEGMTAVKVEGKAGPVNVYAAMADWETWTCTTDEVAPQIGVTFGSAATQCVTPQVATKNSSMKIGASMKFGSVKASVQMANQEAGTQDTDQIMLMADMGLGNGLSVNVALGDTEITNGAAKTEGTYTRVALTKNISKGTAVFGGLTTNEVKVIGGATVETSQMGVGLQVKF